MTSLFVVSTDGLLLRPPKVALVAPVGCWRGVAARGLGVRAPFLRPRPAASGSRECE